MEVQEENNFIQWYNQIVHLKDKVILPNGIKFTKLPYITSNGFNNAKFRTDLYKYYENNVKKE